MKQRWWILGSVLAIALSVLAAYLFLIPHFPPRGIACVDAALEEMNSLRSREILPRSFAFATSSVTHFRCDSVRGFLQFEMKGLDEAGHSFYLHTIAGGIAASGADTILDICYERDGIAITKVKYSGREGVESVGTCSYDEALFSTPVSSYQFNALGFDLRRYLPHSKVVVDQALLTRMQADLRGITPYFVDYNNFDGKPLTLEEAKIKNDVIDILVAKEPENREYYSQLALRAIGKRYVLVSQPSAESAYDIVIDSETGESSFLQNGASYLARYLPLERPLPSQGRQLVIYIGYQDVYTYTIDQPSFALVQGSKLTGSESYHSGLSDAYLTPSETHSENTITLSVFDSSQIVENPEAEPNAMQTMSKKLRDSTLSF